MQEVTAHYEAGSGIRPARRGGRFRAVAHEVVPGGGLELWACDHDHAPGVRDVRQVSDAQRAGAEACAAEWLARQIEDGHLYSMPVVTATEQESRDAADAIVIPLGVTDPQLSDIVVKYRAQVTAWQHYQQLRREIAVLFSGLSPDQQQAYIAACERIDNEERESRA
jgi:hypothetical protein